MIAECIGSQESRSVTQDSGPETQAQGPATRSRP